MNELLMALESLLRVSSPLIFAALGGLVSERAGLVSLGLEGFMLIAAFFSAVATYASQSVWIGAFVGICFSIAFTLLYGFFVIELAANQVVAGIALNLLASGLTPFLSRIFFEASGSTPILPLSLRFHYFPLVFCLIFVIFTHWMLHQSAFGLWIKFSGENPAALLAEGFSVKKIRYKALTFTGFACGCAGACLSIFLSSCFIRNMTAGKGFMAVAAIIFGKWKPIPSFFACLFFGLTDYLQMRLQGVVIQGAEIPVQWVQILPYIITLTVLATFMGHTQGPKHLGSPFP